MGLLGLRSGGVAQRKRDTMEVLVVFFLFFLFFFFFFAVVCGGEWRRRWVVFGCGMGGSFVVVVVWVKG